MSTELKRPKVQISKIIQSGGFLGSLLSKIAGPLMKVAIPLTKKYFSSLRNNSGCFCDRCRNSKENTCFWLPFVVCFWNNFINFNNFKQRNE